MATVTARHDLEIDTEYAAPGDETEARLAELWSAQLGVFPVGVHDDFFELGGDSLFAAELLLTMDREFGVEIPAWTLFLSPTIVEMAQAIAEARKPAEARPTGA
ncbi:acyl carrier protein [Allocatelliglobosispora scoriae]|uniref:Acyl carrier protein n=1 Tax=Allocatelliglobosispora scoriae TaxID=643052 RepID=A0A841C0N6_9ACTN|nr:phosphopantetheine-binding protein [Allocatelliglobosispora scoriae]MBB5872713.1 acyl carrier protein [Allocatelliglobosispora scoriae]